MPRRKPPVDTSANLVFPLQGLDLSTGFNRQRPGTTVTGQNVRAYDAGTLRARGGSRSGLTPFLGAGTTTQVNGFAVIQHLNQITTVNPAATYLVLFTDLLLTMNYKEAFYAPGVNAPTTTSVFPWYVAQSPLLPAVSGTYTIPPGPAPYGGTRNSTMSLRISTDGTTITGVATLLTTGVPWNFVSVGPITQTKTVLNATFFGIGYGGLDYQWTVVNTVSGAIMEPDLRFQPM